MLAVVLAIIALPLGAGAVCLCLPARLAVGATLVSGFASLGLVLTLVRPAAAGPFSDLAGYLRVDAVSVIFLLATGFLYAAVAVYAVGYLQARLATELRLKHTPTLTFGYDESIDRGMRISQLIQEELDAGE